MKTAEEFIREKIREKHGIKGQMYALLKYEVNGEDCLRWAHEYATKCQQDNAERELSYKIFELANELAVAGYGNEAVFLHNIRNRMILTTLNKQ